MPRQPSQPIRPVASSLTDHELADAYDANTLHTLWVTNRGLYGPRKLWKAIHRAGHKWGRDRVQQLMHIAGLSGVRRGRRRTVTTVADPKVPRYPDHIRRRWNYPFRPDQWWVADYVRHEALFDRVEVRDLHHCAVAAA